MILNVSRCRNLGRVRLSIWRFLTSHFGLVRRVLHRPLLKGIYDDGFLALRILLLRNAPFWRWVAEDRGDGFGWGVEKWVKGEMNVKICIYGLHLSQGPLVFKLGN